MESIITQVKASLAELLKPDDTGGLSEATTLSTDLGLDSSQFIQLLMILEDHVPGLLFDPESIRKEDFHDIGSLSRFIQSTVGAAA